MVVSSKQDLGITPQGRVQVGKTQIQVEIAKTGSQIEKGLSDRAHLDPQAGMLFELGQPRLATFWMKDMKIPLDIIWINQGKIVGIEKNAPVPTTDNIPTFRSPQVVNEVLEVNAGFSDQNKLQAGDKVELMNP